ncbi:MAG: dihydroorotate dehydrogenase electron transfer subunit [Candidatus Latescibacterota bacterium]
MVDEKVRVVRSEEVARRYFRTRLAAPQIAGQAAPGQFCQVRVGDGVTPLLRLPLSIGLADPQAGTIDLLYQVVGPKSRALGGLAPGSTTACLGPLGRGFVAPPGGHTAVLAGGGIGIPPLLFWGHRLRAGGWHTLLLVGARTVDRHLPDSLLVPAAHEVRRATDDGGLGHPGPVTGLLLQALEECGPCTVYTCGPHPMMAAVAALCAARGVACQASLEEYMACGIGVCVGCVVELHPEEGKAASDYERYRRVCVDGPVFDARRVRWEWP